MSASPQPEFATTTSTSSTNTTAPLILRESILHGILLAVIGIVGVEGARSGSPVWPSVAAATLIISLAVSLARFIGELIYSHRGNRRYTTLGVNEDIEEVEEEEAEQNDELVDIESTPSQVTATASAANASLSASASAAAAAGARAAERVYREATTLGFSSDDASAMAAIAFAVAEEATVNNRRRLSMTTNTTTTTGGIELPLPAFPWIGVATSTSTSTSTSPSSLKACTICFEPYKKGVLCRALVCAHTYHDACLRKWLAVKPICPECRTHV